MIDSNDIKKIIKECNTKIDGKLNCPNIQLYLCNKLEPLNVSFQYFYSELMNELSNLLSEINNLIQRDTTLFEKNEELDYFYKAFDIFFCITRFCLIKESSSIVNTEKMKIFVNILISIIFKIISVKGKNINEKKYSNQEKFCNYICDIFKTLSEINLDFICEHCLEEKNYFKYLLEEPFTRKIIYDCLKKIIQINNMKEEILQNKIKIINNVIEHLMKKCLNDIDIIINDIKSIIYVYRNNIDIIAYSFFNLLKLICDSYTKEMEIQFDDLFSFFFDQILFEENKNNKNKNKNNIDYNKNFSVILFDLFDYLVNKNDKDLYIKFLIKLFTSINSNDLKEGKKQGKSIKKYQWLLTNTEYINKILNTFPKIFDENLFSFYLASLMAFSEDKNHKKKFLPEIDIITFFKNIDKYLDNKNYRKEYLISFFTKKITDFIKFNDQLIEIILKKCQIFKLIINLVDKETEKNIKNKLLDCLEDISNENNDKFDYDINIDIRTDLNEINTRINLIIIGYECDDNKFNNKIIKLIELMNTYCKEKKIDIFIHICDIIFQIIIDYKFKKINIILDDILNNFNNILLQFSVLLANSQIKDLTDCEKKLENYVQNYLNCIYRFIFQLNKKKFEYKAEKNKKKSIYYTKRIIQKNILKDIVKNLLMSQNHIVKKTTFEYLINFAIDEKNNLILSSYILFIITNIYYGDKNYKYLQKIFKIILNLIKKFEFNAKILLNYDFVSIAIDILCELHAKTSNSDEYYQTTFLFLKEICKYLTQELLMKYLNKLFFIFSKNVLSQITDLKDKSKDNISIEQKRINASPFDIYERKESNDSNSIINDNKNGRINIGYNLNSFEIDNEAGENELNNNIVNNEEINNEGEIINNNPIDIKSKICLDLFNLLKSYLNLYYKNKDDFVNSNLSNYLIISNYLFPNHLINNLLFLDNIKNSCKEKIIIFRMHLKISSYNGINDFNLLQIKNEKVKILFIINEENTLEIKEKNEDYSKILANIENLDKALPADNKFHDIIVEFNNEEKDFNITIDNIKVINKSNKYELFNFDSIKVIIGFNYNSINNSNDINLKIPKYKKDTIIDDTNNKINSNNSPCFIYISYLLIVNNNEMINNQKINELIRKENKYSPNSNLLSYCYRKKNKNLGSNIIVEIDFRNKDMDLCYSSVLNKNKEIKKFIINSNNNYVNKYISFIEKNNTFNDISKTPVLYMISKNENISDYYSLNNICELEKMSKSIICSKLLNDYDIIFNLCNNNIVDFLLGFLFLIEKKFNELKNKEDERDNDKNNNEEVIPLYGNNLLINEEKVIEYILIIFEIIMLIPSQEIKNYFIGNESCPNLLKLKYFFYRNIALMNYDETFLEKILKIFLLEHENKDNKIILNHKLIFISLINEIFLDLNIFEKLEENNQNNIFSHAIELMEKSEYKRKETKEQKENNFLLKLITNLVNIVKYNKLSLVENNEGKTQIDYIINCVDLVTCKVLPNEDKDFENQLKSIFFSINNFSYDNKHINEELCQKYNYIFNSLESDDFSENKNIFTEEEFDKINNQIKSFNSFINQNKNINGLLKNYKNKSKCCFCDYIKTLFLIKKDFIYNEFKFDKLYKYFFRNYYLNLGYNSEIFGKQRYAWFLSLKESHEKLQNKLFLKEDHIKIYSIENPKSKKVTNYFKYDYSQKEYMKIFKELNKLAFYDKISMHYNLIEYINSGKRSKNVYNCLIINKLHKIMSIIILNDESISIYYNIFIDNKNKINIVKRDTTHSFWTKNKDESYMKMNAYIDKNEEEIKKEIYKLNLNDSNKKKMINKFGYDRVYKFNKRIINLKKINEIYKRQHLHISNALEIFINNGESYFIVLNPDNRDILFEKIISKIDSLYKENKLEIFKHSKIWSNNKENCFYIKHSPVIALHQSQESENFIKNHKKVKNINDKNYKIIMDENSLKETIYNNWCKNRISNYDYIMFLNILSGRSLNDLSQYFIFPWIIKDFDKNNLNWLSKEIYRDLSLPIHACGEDKERIISKYELLDDEKYHSGTFYSTHSFVCYFLIRQRPFTEIHLEIQGAKFDAPSRMFNSAEQLSNICEKYQELIPSLFYLPELFIKESCIFESNEIDKEPFSDYILPNWCKNDPRKFTLILNKILESKEVSLNLNSWIDLIFGYKQKGPNAIKSLNIFRNACYPSTKSELDKKEEEGELESYMYEKEELGCIGKQLFNKNHKSKDINSENIRNKRIFFNDNEKLFKLKIKKIKNGSEKGLYKSKIFFGKINDIIFGPNSTFNDNFNKKTYYQGGISSLSSIMNCLIPENNNKSIDSIKKIMKSLTENDDFILLNKNYIYLRKPNLILTYDKKYIELINIGNNISYFYYLKDINGDISSLTTNKKGTKLYIGFTNGNIKFYKIVKKSFDQNVNEDRYISSSSHSSLNEKSLEYKNIYINTGMEINQNTFLFKDTYKIYLKKINKNYFLNNNPHTPKSINLISLNEYHKTLIALDESNLIYIISLNNKGKLMHISHFLSNTKYKMKGIIPLSWNGDFIIYSSYTVHLFSINGIPLCQLSLFDKVYEKMNYIVYCEAAFLYDVTIFTSHKDGSINIWQVQNKDIEEKFDERVSFVFNKKKSKFFLPEYQYGYNNIYNGFSETKIDEYELQRKFEMVSQINFDMKANNYFNFMKISNNLNYMILFDTEKSMYILSNIEEEQSKKDISFGLYKKKNHDRCYNCNKLIIGPGIRPTLINFDNFDSNQNNQDIIDNNITSSNNNNKKVICEECKQKLRSTEYFIYNN